MSSRDPSIISTHLKSFFRTAQCRAVSPVALSFTENTFVRCSGVRGLIKYSMKSIGVVTSN